MDEKDNIIIENVEFSQELYEKNIAENGLSIEYNGGEIGNANN